MKNLLDRLFLTSIFGILNPFLWFVLLAVVPVLFIEWNGNDGFEPQSKYFILSGLVMAAISALYNYSQRKR